MKILATLVIILLTPLLYHSPVHAINYQNVNCDDEPDPGLCKKIKDWYAGVKQPKSVTYQAYGDYPVSCCGRADAYWADKIDKVTELGVFLTITDDRDCKPGNPDGQEAGVTCIYNRRPRNGDQVFIPNHRLDDRYQGNPTGHNVVFLGTGLTAYDGAVSSENSGLWPTVYCAFINVPG